MQHDAAQLVRQSRSGERFAERRVAVREKGAGCGAAAAAWWRLCGSLERAHERALVGGGKLARGENVRAAARHLPQLPACQKRVGLHRLELNV